MHGLGFNIAASVLALLIMAYGLVSQSMAFMAMAFLAMGLMGVNNLLELVRDWRGTWSFCGLHGAVILVWYGLGAFIGLAWGDPWELGVIDYRDYRDLFYAALFLLLTVNLLLLLATLEHRHWRTLIADLSQPAGPVPRPVYFALSLLWLLLVDFVLEGRIDFRSFGVEQGEGIPGAEALVYQTSLALSGYFGWLLGKERGAQKQALVIIVLLFLPVIVIILLGQGRQNLMTHVATFLLVFSWARGRRVTMKHVLLLVFVAAPLLFGGAMVFQAQRLDNNLALESGEENSNLVERLGSASTRLGEGWEEVLETQATTLPQRIFLIAYLKELIGGSDNPDFGHGAESMAQVVMGIPSFIYPEKNEWVVELGGISEMRNPDFGMTDYTDYASSLLTAAYMDFGWLGIPYAALASLFVGMGLAWTGRMVRNELFQVTLISSILVQFLAAEMSFFTTVINVVRLLVLLVPITILLGLSLKGVRQLPEGADARR